MHIVYIHVMYISIYTCFYIAPHCVCLYPFMRSRRVDEPRLSHIQAVTSRRRAATAASYTTHPLLSGALIDCFDLLPGFSSCPIYGIVCCAFCLLSRSSVCRSFRRTHIFNSLISLLADYYPLMLLIFKQPHVYMPFVFVHVVRNPAKCTLLRACCEHVV